MGKLEIRLVGMRHHITPSTLHEIQKACPLAVELRREPKNLRDENAILVECKEKPWKGMKFGYVPRAVAEVTAPRMDKKKIQVTEAWLTSSDPESGEGEMLVTVKRLA